MALDQASARAVEIPVDPLPLFVAQLAMCPADMLVVDHDGGGLVAPDRDRLINIECHHRLADRDDQSPRTRHDYDVTRCASAKANESLRAA